MVSAFKPFNSTNFAKQSSTSISSRASNTLPLSPPGNVTRGSTDHSSIVFLESPDLRSALPNGSVPEDAPSQLLCIHNEIHVCKTKYCNFGRLIKHQSRIQNIVNLPLLCKSFKWRRRCMNTIISLIRDRSKSKFLEVV